MFHPTAPLDQVDAPYSRYAAVYDRIGQRRFGERIAQATLAYLEHHGRSPRSMIDLACGTGAATFEFAKAGLEATGIDRSAAMLAEAARRSQTERVSIDWIEADMTGFKAAKPVDLVTCFYDGINYLTEFEHVELLAATVAAALVRGGLFIFDCNTRLKFSTAWNDVCYLASDTQDLFGVYRSWWEPHTGRSPLRLTFFERAADDAWTRFDEEHLERAYPLEDIREALAGAGFDVIDLFDYADRSPVFGGPGSERSQRVVFVAERNE